MAFGGVTPGLNCASPYWPFVFWMGLEDVASGILREGSARSGRRDEQAGSGLVFWCVPRHNQQNGGLPRAAWSRSTFNDPNIVPVTALSRESPLRPIDP